MMNEIKCTNRRINLDSFYACQNGCKKRKRFQLMGNCHINTFYVERFSLPFPAQMQQQLSLLILNCSPIEAET
jgi:hypothetical protein